MRNYKYTNWRKQSLEERIRNAYERLPKYLKRLETPEEKEITIQSTLGLYERGIAKKSKPFNILRANLSGRDMRRETKREIFRRFRTEDTSLFFKYNSYMFRIGLKSTEYFMRNAETEVRNPHDDSKRAIMTATLKLPSGKKISYSKLKIVIHLGEGGIREGTINSELS